MSRAKAPGAGDFTNQKCKWKDLVDEGIKAKNRWKSRIRSRVEHSIGVIKRVFKFRKVRYRGLKNNANRLYVTAALANIFMLRYTYLGAVRPQLGKMERQACFRAVNGSEVAAHSQNQHLVVPLNLPLGGCANIP